MTDLSSMSCRRALDVDLGTFLLDPRAPEWEDFRAHYPGCAACAAEVRAWTEVQALLAAESAHPAPAVLADLSARPLRLAAAERAAVEGHVARCVSCRDELAALERFDFAGVERAAAAVASPRARFGLLRLALHPAFAYALVLVALAPTIARYLGAPPASSPPPPASAPPAPAALEDRAADERRSLRAAVPEERQEGAKLGAFAARSKAAPATPRLEEAKPADEPAPAPPAGSALGGMSVEADATVSLDVGTAATRVPAGAIGRELVIRVPVPDSARRHSPLEVRVLDEGEKRELRQHFPAATGRDHVDLAVPGAWLVPGAYRVELRVVDRESSQTRMYPYLLSVAR